CSPFVECPTRFTGLLAYQVLARSSARKAGSALVILTVLSGGVPSHCSSHKLWLLQLATTGARPARPEWAPRSESIAAAIWFTGTTKKSHAYVTVIDGFIILDHEDPGRASGFQSHHHIDEKSPRALP
ncbi:hypothetical protein TIFTF001_049983, partial [Ficus carica]